MNITEAKKQWESAAPGWAKWQPTIANWVKPSTDELFEMAGLTEGKRVLDIASGSGSQTIKAAKLVGKHGSVTANDISETMLTYVKQNASIEKLDNISTFAGPAEILETGGERFDSVICNFGLMLFSDPARALTAASKVMKTGGKMAVTVFSTPDKSPFFSRSMQIIMQRAGKPMPPPGTPGLFALGGPGVLKTLFEGVGFSDFQSKTLSIDFNLPPVPETLVMMQEAFGAYRAVLSDCSDETKKAAWKDVENYLAEMVGPQGLVTKTEVIVASGTHVGED